MQTRDEIKEQLKKISAYITHEDYAIITRNDVKWLATEFAKMLELCEKLEHQTAVLDRRYHLMRGVSRAKSETILELKMNMHDLQLRYDQLNGEA